jgi:two-component system LytT family response regulator
MKAIIIEDEQKAADLLEQMLMDISDSIEVVEKCYDLPSGVKSIKKNHPDIVFLDLELPVYSGLQLLEFFNEEEISFALIFTTASNQHAIQAFEMSAIDYILKPIQEEKLKTALQKCFKRKKISSAENISVLQQNMQSPEFKKIVVPVNNGFEIINLSDIMYFKAEGSYTNIFLSDKQSLMVSKNLKYFDDILESSYCFIRIHRSYMANIQYAKKILRNNGYFLVIDDSTQLPIINEKVEEIIKLINR